MGSELDKLERNEQGYLDDGFGLKFPVRILDVDKRYGRIDALVESVGGSGQRWVNYEKIIFTKK